MPSLLVYQAPILGWTHVAVVYQNKQPTLYINGVSVRTGQTSSRSAVYPSSELGGDRSGYGYYAGLLDEVSIYNRALSSSEIAAIFAAGSSGKCYTNTPVPVFIQNPLSQTDYVANAFSLTGAAMGTPRPQYQWLTNGYPLVGATM